MPFSTAHAKYARNVLQKHLFHTNCPYGQQNILKRFQNRFSVFLQFSHCLAVALA